MLKIRIQIRGEQPGSYFRELRNNFLGLKYLNSLTRIRDLGWKNSDPGSVMEKFGSGMEKNWIREEKIRIRDKHPGSANTGT
jgi:hypothetical protein